MTGNFRTTATIMHFAQQVFFIATPCIYAYNVLETSQIFSLPDTVDVVNFAIFIGHCKPKGFQLQGISPPPPTSNHGLCPSPSLGALPPNRSYRLALKLDPHSENLMRPHNKLTTLQAKSTTKQCIPSKFHTTPTSNYTNRRSKGTQEW